MACLFSINGKFLGCCVFRICSCNLEEGTGKSEFCSWTGKYEQKVRIRDSENYYFFSETTLSDDELGLTLSSSIRHRMIILFPLELHLRVSRILPWQVSICHVLGFNCSSYIILSILNIIKRQDFHWPLLIFSLLLSALWTMLCVLYLLTTWRLWYAFCRASNVHHFWFHAQIHHQT